MTITNLKAVQEALARVKKKLDDLNPIARKATLYLLGLVTKNFSSSSPAAKNWPPLSIFTMFLRRRRVSAPNRAGNVVPLNDTGLLRNSNFPFVRENGSEFGIVNNVKYASTHQFGGVSSASTVEVTKFRRKNPATGKRVRLKKGTAPTYLVHIKAGHKIPARPFFPSREEYLPGIMSIMRRYRDDALGGTAGA